MLHFKINEYRRLSEAPGFVVCTNQGPGSTSRLIPRYYQPPSGNELKVYFKWIKKVSILITPISSRITQPLIPLHQVLLLVFILLNN